MATGQYQQPLSAEAEQDKWLDEANENVKKQAFFMKRALDAGDIRQSIKCASEMISELRTSNLSPKNYYELYIAVTDELRDLEAYFEEEDRASGRSIVELYEQVQYAGNIIPRLFLLITVGSVYIKSKKAPAKDILFDLVELCRGVQHPMRGLFLRNYLSQVSKDKLPDLGSEYEGTGGSVKDAIEFVLQNFGEMNKLWVRMQHQGAVRDKAKREKERRNLRQLVGTNLVRLSELGGVDVATYKELVLPRVLEQIVNCKDTISQEYLMEVVIQVFPDDYHLATLETFLGTINQLQKTVNAKNIIIALMNRLSHFAKESPHAVPNSLDMFALFHKYSSEVIEGNPSMPLDDILSLQVALVNFATNVYPNNIQYVDQTLGFSVQVLDKSGQKKVDANSAIQVTQLLTLPLDSLGLAILQLNSFAALMTFLDFETRKSVAVSIVEAVLTANKALDTEEKVDRLFEFISPILKDQEDGKELNDEGKYEFDREQTLAARLFQLIQHSDTDNHFMLYAVARKHYGQGGVKRVNYSLPPLVFGAVKLAERIYRREESKDDAPPKIKSKKVFGFIHETLGALAPSHPDLALRLFLQASLSADRVQLGEIADEFVRKAFVIYEEDISDSKMQYSIITLVIATLGQMRSLGTENYDTFITQAAKHAAKLMKKPDACRAVYDSAHLFWTGSDANPGHRDEKLVLECLQRALKIANSSMESQVHLFVEILDKYLYFYEKNCPSIAVKYLKGLITLIDEHVPTLDNSEVSQMVKKQYQNILLHIKLKQAAEDALGDRFRAITAASSE